MRKRIVIGLLILSAIGTAMFFFSQPKKGSVEWHKREYRRAMNRGLDRITGETFSQRVWIRYQKVTGRAAPPSVWDWNKDYDRFKAHQTALVNMGYLNQERFAVSNYSSGQLETAIWRELEETDEAKTFVRCATENGIVVTAPRTLMPRIREVIRKPL